MFSQIQDAGNYLLQALRLLHMKDAGHVYRSGHEVVRVGRVGSRGQITVLLPGSWHTNIVPVICQCFVTCKIIFFTGIWSYLKTTDAVP